jgi:hypothetical protein
MGRAHSGNTPGRNLAALTHERVQHARVFVIDIVDLLDAEPAHLLAPEILFLSSVGFIATGGSL